MKHVLLAAAAVAAMAASLSADPPSLVTVIPSDLKTDGSKIVTFTFVAFDPANNHVGGFNVLFGDEYDCWFDFGITGISVWNNGKWTTEAASEPGPVLHGNNCDIDPLDVSAQYSNAGTLFKAFVRIRLGGAPGTHNIYLTAPSHDHPLNPYRKVGSWTVTPPAPFTLKVTPADSFIRVGEDAKATVTVTGDPGFAGTVNLSLGAFPDGSNLTGSFSPDSITGSGTATLTIHSTAQTPPGYDPVEIVAAASGGSGERRFEFETFVDNAPPASDMLPVFWGYGSGGRFDFSVSDNGTAHEITGLNILFNSTVDGRNACWIWYDARTDYVWLANDDGLTWQSMPLLNRNFLGNSQCTLDYPRIVRNEGRSGNGIFLEIRIIFSPAFGGLKNVYTRSSNFSGFESGYSLVGQYLVSRPQ
jgi:hypothetical protein